MHRLDAARVKSPHRIVVVSVHYIRALWWLTVLARSTPIGPATEPSLTGGAHNLPAPIGLTTPPQHLILRPASPRKQMYSWLTNATHPPHLAEYQPAHKLYLLKPFHQISAVINLNF